jgi:hypothetical protein
MSRYLAVAAVLATAAFVPVAPASADQICLRVICDHRPVTGCYDTGEVRFCL